jgi:hypothetical protein
MSDYNIGNNRIDDAIDAAVRDIMQLDPRPGLRRRVLSELGSPVRSSSWKLRLLVPAGSLICLLAAFVVLSPKQGQEPGPVAAVTAPAPPPATAVEATMPGIPPPPAAIVADGSTPERMPRSQPGGRRRAATRSNIFGPRTGRAAAASVRPVSQPLHSTGATRDGELAPAFRPRPLLILPGRIVPPLGLPAISPVRK